MLHTHVLKVRDCHLWRQLAVRYPMPCRNSDLCACCCGRVAECSIKLCWFEQWKVL